MIGNQEKNFQTALNLLNTQLLSNPAVLADWHTKRKLDLTLTQKESMLTYLNKLKIDIPKLSSRVVHVAGTKGKGSTCAFVESIIRHHGYSTGLFTSPHLISVRERIKINGKLISEEMFAHYFFQCYDTLLPLWEADESMRPGYFKFLTILAMKIFEGENVDACVFEVGIGGRTDPTNIFDQPVCCGITTLDYDHMEVLGNTLGEIASEKAGIIKKGVPIVTIDQEPEAHGSIIRKANLEHAPLYVASPWELYNPPENILALRGEFQKKNASVASALCDLWLANKTEKRRGHPESAFQLNDAHTFNDVPRYPVFPLSDQYLEGLKNCFWPGRAQIIEKDKIKYFIDGAHTPASIDACMKWFETEITQTKGMRILCFNCKSSKDYMALLKCINDHARFLPFDYIFFTPSRISTFGNKNDKSNILSYNFDSKIAGPLGEQIKYRNTYEEMRLCNDTEANTKLEVFEYVDQTIERINQVVSQAMSKDGDQDEVNVLVTGSLYVVGAFLECLDFNTDYQSK